jgi:hypothetical protein
MPLASDREMRRIWLKIDLSRLLEVQLIAMVALGLAGEDWWGYRAFFGPVDPFYGD